VSFVLGRSRPDRLVASSRNGEVQLWTEQTGKRLRAKFKSVDMPMGEFLLLVQYVLENSDLQGPADPRLDFVEAVKYAVQVKGWGNGPKVQRLELRPGWWPSDLPEQTEMHLLVDEVNKARKGRKKRLWRQRHD